MTGNLSQQLIAEPLQVIHSGAQTGSLVLRQGNVTNTLRFAQGFLVDAQSSDPSEAFGEMLLRMGRLSPNQLDVASKSGSSPEALSQALVAMNLVEPSQLTEFRAFHVQEIAYGLFNWVSGSFEFSAGSDPAVKSKVKLPLLPLIFEAVRRIANPEIIHRGLKGTDKVIRLTSHLESKVEAVFLKPEEAFVLSRIESSARISEILQISPLGLETTQKTLYGFLATGIAEFAEEGKGKGKDEAPIPAASRAYRSSSAPSFRPEAVDVQEETEAEDMESVQADVFLMLDKAKTRNYYDLLCVPTTASPDEIKKSYYSLAKKYHPDRYHQSKSVDLKNALDVIFSTLAQAYDTLKVPATRGSYDAKVFRLETPAGASPDKAAPAASASMAAQQKLADLNYRQGRGQYDQQDYWSAIQAFRQSVRMEPEVARYRYWLAMALSKNAKWRREAEEHFLKAIELEQFNPEHYVGLGLLYKEAGMQKRAESQLKQALQVNPGNKAAQEALDSLMAAQTKKASGLDTLKGLFKKK